MARNPVVFQNGTLVESAKVEVDDVIYDVQPAQYSGTTPLSAANLNLLQTRLYDYIDEVKSNVYIKDNFAVLTGTYTLPAGEGGTYAPDTSVDINYPEGFTVNNCVIVSAMNGKTSANIYGTNIDIGTAGPYAIGVDHFYFALLSNKIVLRKTGTNPTQNEQNYQYKLVLLKYTD